MAVARTVGRGGNYRSTESGAGMTAKGVAAYNRKTGGNLKTAVTEKKPSRMRQKLYGHAYGGDKGMSYRHSSSWKTHDHLK